MTAISLNWNSLQSNNYTSTNCQASIQVSTTNVIKNMIPKSVKIFLLVKAYFSKMFILEYPYR